MANNLETFKGALKFGGARPSLFDINIAAPTFTGTTFTSLSKSQYQCEVSSIPGLTITPIEKQYFGRILKLPGELSFANLSTTFTNPEDFGIFTDMELWMNALNGQKSNLGISGKMQDWSGTVTLNQYGKDGTKNQTWKFIHCWPSTVSAIALDYDGTDLETFDVTWEYSHYEYDNLHSKGGSFKTQN